MGDKSAAVAREHTGLDTELAYTTSLNWCLLIVNSMDETLLCVIPFPKQPLPVIYLQNISVQPQV